MTNLTNQDVIINYSVNITWNENEGYSIPFPNAPQIIRNNIETYDNNLYFADVDEINDNLDDSLNHIKLKNFEYSKGDTILNISINLKPKETIYFGWTTHFADLYGTIIHSKMVVKNSDLIILDTKTLAEIFDRENRFKVNRYMIIFGEQAKNVALWARS